MQPQTYTIGQVSRKLDVEQHTLRYWEKEFKDFIHPQRVSRRYRAYTDTDVIILRQIKDLLTVDLFTIAGARRQMSLRGQFLSHGFGQLIGMSDGQGGTFAAPALACDRNDPVEAVVPLPAGFKVPVNLSGHRQAPGSASGQAASETIEQGAKP